MRQNETETGIIISWVLFLAAVCLVAIALPGCSGTKGWQVGFGVYPVTAINQVQSLQPEKRVINRD